MTDTTLNRYLASGTAAERAAFTPSPATPASGPDPTHFWFETDTGDCYAWNFDTAAWVKVVSAAAASVAWGTITGTLSSQTDLQSALNAKAALAGATFTGAISATNLSGTNTGDQDLSGYLTSAAAASTYQPIGTYYTPGGTDVAVADGGTGSSTASGARTNLAAAAQSQTAEQISGFIASPSNKDYRIVLDMKHGGTITEVTTRSASGTCTASFKINTTALGGTANSVSSTETTQTHSSANVFAAGDDIVLTVSSNSSCADMSFTIKYTRTLA